MDQQHTSGKPVPGTPLYRVALALRNTALGDDVEVMVGDIKDVANACGRNAADAVAMVRDLVKGKSVGTTVMVSEDVVSDLVDGATAPQPQPPSQPRTEDSAEEAPRPTRRRTRKPDPISAVDPEPDGVEPREPITE